MWLYNNRSTHGCKQILNTSTSPKGTTAEMVGHNASRNLETEGKRIGHISIHNIQYIRTKYDFQFHHVYYLHY